MDIRSFLKPVFDCMKNDIKYETEFRLKTEMFWSSLRCFRTKLKKSLIKEYGFSKEEANRIYLFSSGYMATLIGQMYAEKEKREAEANPHV